MSVPSVTPIPMPELGNSMEEGTVLVWRVSVGDLIVVGQVLCEIETDKATMEYESPHAGRVARILCGEGETWPVREPMMLLGDNDAAVDSFLNRTSSMSGRGHESPAQHQETSLASTATGESTATVSPTAPATTRIKASPAARKRARATGVDLTNVTGSGPGGRITSRDVDAATVSHKTPAGEPSSETITSAIPRMRKAIGDNLQRAFRDIPHFFVRSTVRADKMLAYREQHKATTGCSISDIIVWACGKALAQHPEFRRRHEGDSYRLVPSANIGIAVALDDGLVVPVLDQVDQLSLADVAANSRELIDRARQGMVTPSQNSVFTISNLGMMGVEEFTAIINPPEAAILAVGAVREEALCADGRIVPGHVMTLTLSCDHRTVDGAHAARFIATLTELLEDPAGKGDYPPNPPVT